MNPLLTIGITSYNRVNELIRCINSISTQYRDSIEILISEDKSPSSRRIEEAVTNLSERIPYNVRFTSNEINLGYDMNLGAIIQKANGKYIFFMSDDDALCGSCLDEIILFLQSEEKCGVLYAPFVYADSGKKDRVRSNSNFRIEKGENSAAKYIYDSILFSGLIFRKEYVKTYDSSRFKNHNYFQVYIFLQMMLKYGGYYFANPSVLCIGDGENAYGLSESSRGETGLESLERNKILSNRKSVISNLEFNVTLAKVIHMFDDDEGTQVFQSFAKQYSLHSVSGLSKARKEGRAYYKNYWDKLKKIGIPLSPIAYAYYILLLIFGEKATTIMLSGIRKRVKRE